MPDSDRGTVPDGVELQLAPPAPELPPQLLVNGSEASWFALDWNSTSLVSVLSEETGNAIHLPASPEVSFTLEPAAEPIRFEVAVYEGNLESADPTQAPIKVLDCLQPDSACELHSDAEETYLTVTQLTDEPYVLVLQARYFAPPEVNPDRLANEAAWLIELQAL